MPIYEYSCPACSGVTEVIQKVDAPAPDICPKCQATGPLVKLMSLSGFILKGGGWYETDFRGGGPRAAEKPEAKDASAPAAATAGGEGASAKSDKTDGAKPATTAAPASEKAEKSEKKKESSPAPAAKAATTSGT